jgi:hypothetical protein
MRKMKTPMTYPIRFWALVLTALLLYQFSTNASAESCKYEKIIDKTMDLSGSEVLRIAAAAGDLKIVGVPGSGQAVIHGRACASTQAWLEQSDVITTPGNSAAIEVSLPEVDGGWLSLGNNYLWLDLDIEVPQDLALDIRDSSGDMTVRDTATAQIRDSSGNIEVAGALGPVSINDSSGGIEITGVNGDVTIESDSSGDIEVEDVTGSVLVMSDSSGDIEVSQVSGDFVVERDSSGDISAEDIGGDFRVLRDGSGGISLREVKGEVDIPEKS